MQYDIFVLYSIGEDEKKRPNEDRVKQVISLLQSKGITTSNFDEINQSIVIDTSCIEQSKCVVIFIDRNYFNNVSLEQWNIYKSQYQNAKASKGVRKFIPLVMEPRMLDYSKWTGPAGIDLHGMIYTDLSFDFDDEEFLNIKCDEIISRMKVIDSTIGSSDGIDSNSNSNSFKKTNTFLGYPSSSSPSTTQVTESKTSNNNSISFPVLSADNTTALDCCACLCYCIFLPIQIIFNAPSS